MASDKRALTNVLLGGALDELLVEWRRTGISWEGIARKIWVDTQVYVTSQTVRTWAAELENVA
jgi:hypothetical protein